VILLLGLIGRQVRFADHVNLIDFDSRFDAALAYRALGPQSVVPGLRNEILTGLGNLQWGNIRWLDPVSLAAVIGPGVYSMASASIAATAIVFTGTWWFGRCIGCSRVIAIGAGIVAAAMAVGPGVIPAILSDQFRLVPVFPVIAAVTVTILGSFERVGSTRGWRRLGHGAVIVSASTYLVVAQTHYVVLSAFVCVLGASAILVHRRCVGASVRTQVFVVVALLVAWVAAGVATYVRGFLSNVAAVELGERFTWAYTPLGSGLSLPVRTWFPNATSELVRLPMLALTLIGLLVGAARWRSSAGRLCGIVAAVLIGILAYRVSQRWWPRELGPTSDYLTWMSIPLVATVAVFGLGHLASTAASRVRLPAFAALGASSVLAIGMVLLSPQLEDVPPAFPIEPAAGWRRIVATTSLDRDPRFRGRTVVLPLASSTDTVTLGRAVPFDQTLRWGVPVLNEHSHLQTPASFDFFSRFLFRAGDGQVRNHPGLRVANTRILPLLGVRYVVSDRAPVGGGFDPVRGENAVETPYGPMQLFESTEFNDGSWSPTHVVLTTSRVSTFEVMSDEGFSLQSVLVTEDPSLRDRVLHVARDVALTYRAGDLHVTANSDGESILVLPLEYSHCLRASSAGGAVPSLHRVFGVLTGLRFTGRLDTQVDFRFAPGLRAGCRFADLADFRAAT
jgi:hypothetical protein